MPLDCNGDELLVGDLVERVREYEYPFFNQYGRVHVIRGVTSAGHLQFERSINNYDSWSSWNFRLVKRKFTKKSKKNGFSKFQQRIRDAK